MKHLITVIALVVASMATTEAQTNLDSLRSVMQQKEREMQQLSDELDQMGEELRSMEQASNPDATPAYDWRTYRNAISISISNPSLPLTLANLGNTGTVGRNFFYDVFSPALYRNAMMATPNIAVDYHYRLLRWLWLGGNCTYANFHQDIRTQESDNLYYRDNTHHIHLHASVKFSYFSRRHVMLYSGAQLGAIVSMRNFAQTTDGVNPEYNRVVSVLPNFNAVLFGVQAGGERLYALTELCAGTKGFLHLGIGYRF